MLRAFFPATAGLVVLIGLLDARFSGMFGGDRVRIAAWFAVLGTALVTLLVSRRVRRKDGKPAWVMANVTITIRLLTERVREVLDS